jgi:hypothetical protein
MWPPRRPTGLKHQFRITDLHGVGDLTGFSGSPVFTVHDPDRRLGFAGTMIQGTSSSCLGHFVDSAVLANVLRQINGAA